MGLTSDASGLKLLRKSFNLELEKNNPIVALCGNPNTGKSTVFNGLTGLKQHTGNWPGKTVTQAKGYYNYNNQEYTLVDLPGTYSLLTNSSEEKVARDFICFAQPDVTIVVVDATNLERNLNLVLQVMELTDNVVLCLNLMDEAERKDIKVDIKGLKEELQIPVIPTVAIDEIGFKEIKNTVDEIINDKLKVTPRVIEYSPKIEEKVDQLVAELKAIWEDLEFEINLRWLALRLLEGDETVLESLNDYYFKPLGGEKIDQLESEVQSNEVLRG
ncbi:FeoB small GTPase domain-containing protein [Halanaerobaculum tunisiense]